MNRYSPLYTLSFVWIAFLFVSFPLFSQQAKTPSGPGKKMARGKAQKLLKKLDKKYYSLSEHGVDSFWAGAKATLYLDRFSEDSKTSKTNYERKRVIGFADANTNVYRYDWTTNLRGPSEILFYEFSSGKDRRPRVEFKRWERFPILKTKYNSVVKSSENPANIDGSVDVPAGKYQHIEKNKKTKLTDYRIHSGANWGLQDEERFRFKRYLKTRLRYYFIRFILGKPFSLDNPNIRVRKSDDWFYLIEMVDYPTEILYAFDRDNLKLKHIIMKDFKVAAGPYDPRIYLGKIGMEVVLKEVMTRGKKTQFLLKEIRGISRHLTGPETYTKPEDLPLEEKSATIADGVPIFRTGPKMGIGTLRTSRFKGRPNFIINRRIGFFYRDYKIKENQKTEIVKIPVKIITEWYEVFWWRTYENETKAVERSNYMETLLFQNIVLNRPHPDPTKTPGENSGTKTGH